MQIKRFEINEDLARYAHAMNSMRDYEPNRATNSYATYLGEFLEAVTALIDKTPEERKTAEIMESVEYYTNRYSYKLAEAINEENRIESMCPSILISGGSNFPVRKKEKQNARRKSFHEQYGQIFEPTNNYYFNKIRNLLTNNVVYSSDKFVLEKLQNKLEDLKKLQDEMKAQNAYYKANGTMKGYDGLTDSEAEK